MNELYKLIDSHVKGFFNRLRLLTEYLPVSKQYKYTRDGLGEQKKECHNLQ